jgi:hypothetical protein
MRAILLILIVLVAALIVAFATGLLDVTQTRTAKAPDVAATSNGISASGGQAPAFDVETGSVTVGAKQANVTVPVPTLNVNPANEQGAAAQNSAR